MAIIQKSVDAQQISMAILSNLLKLCRQEADWRHHDLG
jgi:hypothetical protein